MSWSTIESAPTERAIGNRGELILGCDADGLIGRTFYISGHPKGDGWLLCSDGEGLALWEPTLWCHLPEQFRDRDGRSYMARKALGEVA